MISSASVLPVFKAGLILTGITCSCSHSAQEAVKPNIVIILADDLGYGDLSCQNSESKIQTPYLDKLASQGMRFTDAHSASGVSSPSRYSLLTGRYHWRGHLKSGIVSQWGDPAIESGRPTIASILKQEGYATACIGKWHLGWDWPFISGLGQKDTAKREWKSVSMNGKENWTPDDFDWSRPLENGPVAKGFDYYFGTGTINFPPYTWIENDHVLETPVEMLDLKDTRPPEGSWECRPGPAARDWDINNVPLRLVQKAVQWIDSRKGQNEPFFLYFPLPSPHAPIIPGEQFRGRSGAGAYGDYVIQTDWMAGQVIEAIERNGFKDNTIIIFSSDNGPEKYAYPRIQNYQHYSMGALRGLKRDLWEGGHRVPFIVKYDGVIPAGTVNDHLICQTDILATVAGLIGISLPDDAGEDSFDNSRMLKSRRKGIPGRDHLVHHTINGSYAIRMNNWLLIEAESGDVSKEPDWLRKSRNLKADSTEMILYDLHKDPGETTNLYTMYPQKAAEMKSLLDRIRKEKSSKSLNITTL